MTSINSDRVVAIQARMSSKRFPGKVLATLQGKPIIEHVIDCFAHFDIQCFVLTSHHVSDDPLDRFVQSLNVEVFRGSLENVLDRYESFLKSYPFSQVVRISADSPILHPEIVSKMLNIETQSRCDIITNIFPRTFPKGQSVEIIRSESLNKMKTYSLLKSHREHVTSFIYENPQTFQIFNFFNSRDFSDYNMCVDYPKDLIRLEQILGELDISLSSGLPSWEDLSNLMISRLW